MFGIPETKIVQVIIVSIITLLFILSAITGIDKGIKALSNINLFLAVILVMGAFFIGPTAKIINTFFNGLGMYLGDFVGDSFNVKVFTESTWYGSWTIFYWAWWIAWAPFVATFIARISKGRTIREFVIGVVIVPSLGSFFWFSVFGSLSIDLGLEMAKEAITSTPTAFFEVMSHYPFGFGFSIIAVILLATFFITSADSATFVLGMMSDKGNLNPSRTRKIFWGIIQSLLALTLMFAGGLKMLQTASIIAAFPLGIVMVVGMFSFIKALRQEVK